MKKPHIGWTKDEEAVLKRLYTPDCDLGTIARAMQRSIGGIAHRLVVLGLAERKGRAIVRKTNVKDGAVSVVRDSVSVVRDSRT